MKWEILEEEERYLIRLGPTMEKTDENISKLHAIISRLTDALKITYSALAHPAPEAATIDAAIAFEVMRAIRTVRQDVRPYMRHLEDCELVRFRQGYYSPSETKCPPCSCGLEKVLWDLPAENETGKTK